MPVADLAQGFRVHAGACLARIKEHHQDDEEHHVAGEGAEYEGAHAIEELARAAAGTLPIVVSAPASATGGSAVDGRLSPIPGDFCSVSDGMG